MDIKPPEKTSTDHKINLVKAGLESVPGGQLISFGIQQFFQLPLDRRVDAFYLEVCDLLKKHSIQISDLQSNDRFVSNLMSAIPIAVKTHKKEKLLLLRNAVINSINPPSYDESLEVMFLALVDRFSHWHLKLLEIILFLNSKNERPFGRYETVNRVRNALYPTVLDDEFLIFILSDLKSSGLIDYAWDSVEADALHRGSSHATISKVGKEFLSFISEKEI